MLPSKCACVGAAKNSKNTYVWYGSVWDEKQLCAECVDMPKLSEDKYSDLWIRHNAQVSEAKVS